MSGNWSVLRNYSCNLVITKYIQYRIIDFLGVSMILQVPPVYNLVCKDCYFMSGLQIRKGFSFYFWESNIITSFSLFPPSKPYHIFFLALFNSRLWFLFICLFWEKVSLHVCNLSWNLLCRPGRTHIQRSAS